MAATGFTPIILFNSTTASALPTTSNLAVGELALNVPDGKLYFNQSGTIKVLAGVGGLAGGSNTQVQYNSSGALAGSANLVFNGTTLTANTIGAFTLAGTIAGGGNQINNVIIGTTTPLAGSFTTLSASGVATFSAGTVSLPAITTTGDTNTGIYFPAADTIAFTEGGAESMRINSNGQLLVNGSTGTALITVTASNTYPALKVPNIVETANTVAGAPASTQTFYLGSGAVQYYTSNAANNWTVNFAMSAGTAMNTAMAVGDSMSCTMMTTQGSTAYYNSAVQIDGTTSGVSTKWQGGTAPTSGNASSLDVYTYVIYKTASATYTVLASQTKFA
jgi:hypothetical protein